MKVLLIDDHPLILSALQAVVASLEEVVEVVTADSAQAARRLLVARDDLGLVLLDLHLGDADGFELLTELRSSYPALPVVVVSASDRASDVIRAIDQGAMGFVPKRANTEVLLDALRLVMSGGIYVPALSLGSDAAPPREAAQAGGAAAPSIATMARSEGFQTMPEAIESLSLTPRQTDVLALLLQGKPNKLIARELGVSVETVKDHVAAVMKALGVSSRTQAVLAVSQMTQRGGELRFSAWRAGATS